MRGRGQFQLVWRCQEGSRQADKTDIWRGHPGKKDRGRQENGEGGWQIEMREGPTSRVVNVPERRCGACGTHQCAANEASAAPMRHTIFDSRKMAVPDQTMDNFPLLLLTTTTLLPPLSKTRPKRAGTMRSGPRLKPHRWLAHAPRFTVLYVTIGGTGLACERADFESSDARVATQFVLLNGRRFAKKIHPHKSASCSVEDQNQSHSFRRSAKFDRREIRQNHLNEKSGRRRMRRCCIQVASLCGEVTRSTI
ncbi:hypothetical protein C8R43DRAFT_955209 [Mycena crocata]|nr:hypothetical protein C8R43DRAFT_955209 [Mycena crocata]